MRSEKFLLGIIFVTIALSGCGPDHSEELTALQKQMGNVNQQIDETRKQVESLLRENQKHGKQLEALETQLERLSVREVVPPPTPAPVGAKPHEGTPTRPAAAATKQPAIIQPAEQIPPQVSCAQVWRQLGQGKPPAAVAQTLGTTVEVIRACEQKIGKGGGR